MITIISAICCILIGAIFFGLTHELNENKPNIPVEGDYSHSDAAILASLGVTSFAAAIEQIASFFI